MYLKDKRSALKK